jgi:hypothetical protein
MIETYTRKEAMRRLGIRSVNAFKVLAEKYPKAAVDKFAEERGQWQDALSGSGRRWESHR